MCSSGRFDRLRTRRSNTSKSGFSQIGDAGLADALARRFVEEGAAAGRQHLGAVDEQPRDHPALALAKIGFAEALENLRDRHLRARLDFGVGVDEGQAEALGEPLADGGLSRAHHADEHDRTPAQSGGEPFGVDGRGFVHAILPNAEARRRCARRAARARFKPPFLSQRARRWPQARLTYAKGRLARRAKTCKHTIKGVSLEGDRRGRWSLPVKMANTGLPGRD